MVSAIMHIQYKATAGMFLILLLPTGAFAAKAVQAYEQVTGPFETQEEAEAACMKAVGLNETTVRLYTGHIGNFWKLDNPLRFLVRRCLSNVKKNEENLRLSTRKIGRMEGRIQKRLTDRSKMKLQQNIVNVRKNTAANARLKLNQNTRSTQENIRTFVNARSQRRVQTQAQERNLREKLDKRKQFQKEAELICRGQKGNQHVMCIRKEVREREEALYGD